MVNRAIVMGKLVSDPETAVIEGGSQCSFTVACTENWKDKSGVKQDRTERVRVVTYRSLADACSRSLAAGRMVYVEGKLRTREYPGKDGARAQRVELDAQSVIFLGAKPEAAEPFADLPF